MRTIGVILSVLLAAGLYAGSSVPVFSADNGTVTATVSVQDVPCITLGVTTLNHGTKAFSSTTLVTDTKNISNIDSCSSAAQTLLATGSNATGSGVTWTPVATVNCSSTPKNQYRMALRNPGPPTVINLSLAAQPFGSLSADQQDFLAEATLTMPCTGSDGAGETMSMSITLTATVP